MGGLVRAGGEISRARTARRIERHHHLMPYAALVLRGGYVEAGDRGRFLARPGDVLFHDAFEAHRDQFDAGGADILNLPIPHRTPLAAGRLADPDAVVRAAESDPAVAASLLLQAVEPGAAGMADWPDLLARDLGADRVERLGDWADAAGLHPSSVSRGFRMCYGVSPQRYRLEQRAARAARAAREPHAALALVAAEHGFADQAHMTRAIRHCFGCTPSTLRVH